MKYLHTMLSFSNFLTFCIKENKLGVQFILSIFNQKPLHVLGVSTDHHQEAHHMFIKIGT